MIIPSKLKVGGHTYKVLQNYRFTQISKVYGQVDYNLGEIRLASIDESGYNIMQSRIEETFLHEIIHCVNEVYSNNIVTEEQVIRMSQGLYQVLKDNELLREA